MKRLSTLRIVDQEIQPSAPPSSARLVRVDVDGTVWIKWHGSRGPRKARVAGTLAHSNLLAALSPAGEVLLTVDSNGEPVVFDVVHERLDNPGGTAQPHGYHALIDGKRVSLEGTDRVELRCGKASITLSPDGRIVIRGTELLSKASGANRIRGGSVEIN